MTTTVTLSGREIDLDDVASVHLVGTDPLDMYDDLAAMASAGTLLMLDKAEARELGVRSTTMDDLSDKVAKGRVNHKMGARPVHYIVPVTDLAALADAHVFDLIDVAKAEPSSGVHLVAYGAGLPPVHADIAEHLTRVER